MSWGRRSGRRRAWAIAASPVLALGIVIGAVAPLGPASTEAVIRSEWADLHGWWTRYGVTPHDQTRLIVALVERGVLWDASTRVPPEKTRSSETAGQIEVVRTHADGSVFVQRTDRAVAANPHAKLLRLCRSVDVGPGVTDHIGCAVSGSDGDASLTLFLSYRTVRGGPSSIISATGAELSCRVSVCGPIDARIARPLQAGERGAQVRVTTTTVAMSVTVTSGVVIVERSAG